MKITKKIIVIVNAYSTAKHLPHHFIGNGYQCIHVATKLNVVKSLAHQVKLDERNFIQNIELQDDNDDAIAKVVAQLKYYNVKAVLPGSESSVIIADKIASHFPILKNDHHSSIARRHKFHMIDRLKQHKLLTQKQIVTDNIRALLAWYEKSGLKKIILKPPMSTGSDNVYICYNQQEITTNFAKIHTHSNLYGFANHEVVAQEFIEGTEYVVNSVSRDGKHFISDIWCGHTHEQDGIIHDDYADLVSRHSQLHDDLTQYTKQMLSALGIQNGPAHSEIRHNSNGFYLIESGARLAGAIDPSAMTDALGHNQVGLTAETILAPAQFDERVVGMSTTKESHMRYVYFTSETEDTIRNTPDFEEMLALSTIHSLYFSPEVGDEIQQSSSIGEIYGFAYLIAKDKSQIEEDYLQFKNLLKQFHQKLFA